MPDNLSDESDDEDERPSRRRRLAERAAEGAVDPEEVSDGCFTLHERTFHAEHQKVQLSSKCFPCGDVALIEQR